jgi:GAF domain-containing protein
MTITNPSQPSNDRLPLLYRLSQAFNSSLDLDEVLNRMMDEVIATMRAERGFVMLQEADGRLVFRYSVSSLTIGTRPRRRLGPRWSRPLATLPVPPPRSTIWPWW